jgi:hypothetical protein
LRHFFHLIPKSQPQNYNRRKKQITILTEWLYKIKGNFNLIYTNYGYLSC